MTSQQFKDLIQPFFTVLSLYEPRTKKDTLSEVFTIENTKSWLGINSAYKHAGDILVDIVNLLRTAELLADINECNSSNGITEDIVHIANNLLFNTKSVEYNCLDDRLSNFKTASMMAENTPYQALIGMVAKHWAWLLDACNGEVPVTYNKLTEHVPDILNYKFLLYALYLDMGDSMKLPIGGINASSN